MPAVSEDAGVRAMLDAMFQEVVDFSNVVIGAMPPLGLSAARPDIRNKEMAIGNTVCDAMLAGLLANVRPSYTSLPAPPSYVYCTQS